MDDAELIKSLAAEVDRRASAVAFSADQEEGLLISVASQQIKKEFGIDFEVGQPIGPTEAQVREASMARFDFLVRAAREERKRILDALETEKLGDILGGEESS